MNENVYWTLELEVAPGGDRDFRELMAEMVKATHDQEPGALNYEWSTSPDGRVCHLYERYADSNATMKHLQSFSANFAERFLAVLKPIRFVVYGAPNEAVREALAGFAPVFMQSADGFSRPA